MKLLEKHFEIALETPVGITRLRELILKLAMQGKLVEQNLKEQSAYELIEEIKKERQKLIKLGKIRKHKELELIKNDETFYQLPSNWKWARLNDFGTWKSGSTPNRSNSSFYNGSIPWVKSGEVKQGLIKETSEAISELALKKCSLDINPRGSVLVAMYGANIGEVGILDIEATTNQAVCACNTFSLINNKYLFNLISSLKQNFISQGAGAAQPNISREKIINTIVPLPPFEEQKRIVEKIEQLMLLCDKLEEERNSKNKLQLQMNSAAINNIIKATDEKSFNNAWSFIANQFDTLYTVNRTVSDLKNIILELASRGKIVNQNNNDISVEEKINRYSGNIYDDEKLIKIKNATIPINEIPYKVPNNWKWLRLMDIARYNGRPNVKPTEIFDDTWVLDLEDIEKDTSRILNTISNLERQSKSTKSSFKKGDVLYGKLRPYLNKVIIANEDGVCTTEIVPIVPSKLVLSEYLVILLKRSTFLNYVNSLAYGVKMPRLGTNDAEMSIHPIPPLEEQVRIVKKVKQLFELCDQLEKNIEQSSKKQSQILNAVLAQV